MKNHGPTQSPQSLDDNESKLALCSVCFTAELVRLQTEDDKVKGLLQSNTVVHKFKKNIMIKEKIRRQSGIFPFTPFFYLNRYQSMDFVPVAVLGWISVNMP